MPVTAVQHIHTFVVILFLILFIVKAFLLFTNKHHALNNVKRYTRMLDIIFGSLLVASGLYLVVAMPQVPGWLLAKMGLVLVSIPVSILGIKKHHKMLTALSLILFSYIYSLAETRSFTLQQPAPPARLPENSTETSEKAEPAPVNAPEITDAMAETALANAHSIYLQQCAGCHGEDGRKSLNNAPLLSRSLLTSGERKAVILKGKGAMPGYRGQISEQEAEELAAYTQTLN